VLETPQGVASRHLQERTRMKLYFAPRTRATRARWLLEELGVPYELATGEAPALVDGDLTLRESLAICLHLADRFPDRPLAPAVGSVERGLYYQWMVLAEVHLDAEVMAFYTHASSEALANHGARLKTLLDAIHEGLEGREFLVGGAFTAADVVMTSILHLAYTLKLLEGYPGLVEYVHRHTRRPAVRRAVSG
jgi:glutathione S-transferase